MTDTAQLWDELVALVATCPGSPERLLHDHQPNEQGLCRACGAGGTGLPCLEWPCMHHQIGTDALALLTADYTRKLAAVGRR